MEISSKNPYLPYSSPRYPAKKCPVNSPQNDLEQPRGNWKTPPRPQAATHLVKPDIMDDAWNELSFDFEPAVQAALPASALGNTRDRFRTQVCVLPISWWGIQHFVDNPNSRVQIPSLKYGALGPRVDRSATRVPARVSVLCCVFVVELGMALSPISFVLKTLRAVPRRHAK